MGLGFSSFRSSITFSNQTKHVIGFELLLPTGKIEISGNFSIPELQVGRELRVSDQDMFYYLKSEHRFQIQSVIHVNGDRLILKLNPNKLLHSDQLKFTYNSTDRETYFRASFYRNSNFVSFDEVLMEGWRLENDQIINIDNEVPKESANEMETVLLSETRFHQSGDVALGDCRGGEIELARPVVVN